MRQTAIIPGIKSNAYMCGSRQCAGGGRQLKEVRKHCCKELAALKPLLLYCNTSGTVLCQMMITECVAFHYKGICILLNYHLCNVPITTVFTAAVDKDTGPDNLTFTVSSPKNGHLAVVSSPSTPVRQFKQAQINNWQVLFIHTGTRPANRKHRQCLQILKIMNYYI
jgi:hypothetical protein